MKKSIFVLVIIIHLALYSCKEKKHLEVTQAAKQEQPIAIAYHFENPKLWLEVNGNDSKQLNIVLAINRTDKANLKKMDSVLIPNERKGNIKDYLPFPQEVSSLKAVDKIVFFSYPTQTFAAYKNGTLVYTGPTNMGRKKDPTPTGLFYTNWKAEKTVSTFNDEWDLLWNFNIANKLGVGWHQYELPGYPASHSCLRLQEKDARYLYNWAAEWVLADEETVAVKGTPVIIFGSYNFEAPKPWLQLTENPHALDISSSEIEKLTTPYLNAILAEQKIRKNFQIGNAL